jgi:hypothetical protein
VVAVEAVLPQAVVELASQRYVVSDVGALHIRVVTYAYGSAPPAR